MIFLAPPSSIPRTTAHPANRGEWSSIPTIVPALERWILQAGDRLDNGRGVDPRHRGASNRPIAKSGAHFGCGAGAPPEAPGGGTTFGSRALGAGFSMAGSTSLGWRTPFDWFSSLLRFCAGGLASGTVSFGAGLVAWANAAPAMNVTPAAIV
jgi:hypothetical protein